MKGLYTEQDVQEMIELMTSEFKLKCAKRFASKKLLVSKERRPPTLEEIEAELVNAPEYTELKVSMNQFRKGFCKCIQRRKGTQCDCALCVFVSFNMSRFHQARAKWWTETPCEVPTCCCRNASYRAASRSAHDMQDFILCPFMDDSLVNGHLREATIPLSPTYPAPPPPPALVDLVEQEAAEAVQDAASRKQKLKDWQQRSPRLLSLRSDEKPFRVRHWGCVNGECANVTPWNQKEK